MFNNTIKEIKSIKTKEDAVAAANEAGHKLRESINKAETEISSTYKSVSEYVNKKPVQSSIIALGIGYVIGSIFRR